MLLTNKSKNDQIFESLMTFKCMNFLDTDEDIASFKQACDFSESNKQYFRFLSSCEGEGILNLSYASKEDIKKDIIYLLENPSNTNGFHFFKIKECDNKFSLEELSFDELIDINL